MPFKRGHHDRKDHAGDHQVKSTAFQTHPEYRRSILNGLPHGAVGGDRSRFRRADLGRPARQIREHQVQVRLHKPHLPLQMLRQTGYGLQGALDIQVQQDHFPEHRGQGLQRYVEARSGPQHDGPSLVLGSAGRF